MQNKAIISTILLFAANVAWASGGISIDNVDQHTDANNRAMTQTERVEISTQGHTIPPATEMTVKDQDVDYTVDIESLFNDLS